MTGEPASERRALGHGERSTDRLIFNDTSTSTTRNTVLSALNNRT